MTSDPTVIRSTDVRTSRLTMAHAWKLLKLMAPCCEFNRSLPVLVGRACLADSLRASAARSSNSSSGGHSVCPMNLSRPETHDRIISTSSSKHSEPLMLKSTSSKQNLALSSNVPLQHRARPAINSRASILPLLSSSIDLKMSCTRVTDLNVSNASNCMNTRPYPVGFFLKRM